MVDGGRLINDTIRRVVAMPVTVTVEVKLVGFDGRGNQQLRIADSDMRYYLGALQTAMETVVLEPHLAAMVRFTLARVLAAAVSARAHLSSSTMLQSSPCCALRPRRCAQPVYPVFHWQVTHDAGQLGSSAEAAIKHEAARLKHSAGTGAVHERSGGALGRAVRAEPTAGAASPARPPVRRRRRHRRPRRAVPHPLPRGGRHHCS